jgi:hypothetical protein
MPMNTVNPVSEERYGCTKPRNRGRARKTSKLGTGCAAVLGQNRPLAVNETSRKRLAIQHPHP